MMKEDNRSNRWIRTWLLIGVVMVFFQIVIGGVTRLTGSGLSITRWEIVTGTIPPLNASDWQAAFEDYQATPQYLKINAGMSLDQFKFIYFWEYVHRLWARSMGMVFAIPFVFFLGKGWLSKRLVRRLGVVVALAFLAAAFGWIMVASGLIDRPWVNAYKLTIHLSLGVSLFVYLFYTWLEERGYERVVASSYWKSRLRWVLGLVIIQLALGGLMSGMKASLNYPTWPDMYGEWIPAIVLDGQNWTVDNFLLYDQSGFMPALVQTLHRNLAYIILIVVVLLIARWLREMPGKYHSLAYGMVGIILAQIALGILTLIGSVGSIPVFYGAMHQGVGILLLAYLFYIYLIVSSKQID